MQTLPELALEFVAWERKELPKGGYRIVNARAAGLVFDTELYTERIDFDQFNDSLVCVNLALGIVGGFWVGMEKQGDGMTHVLGMRME